MGIFDKFRKQVKESSSAQSGAQSSQIFYQIAYFMLPQILYSDSARVIPYFDKEAIVNAGAFLYVMFSKAKSLEPSRELISQFQQHTGTFSEGRRYYVIEYPKPLIDPVMQLDMKAVLAPYFSAIIETEATGAMEYFILGQSPMGGATLRTVTPDGLNANLGPGSAPEVEAFLASLRQRREA